MEDYSFVKAFFSFLFFSPKQRFIKTDTFFAQVKYYKDNIPSVLQGKTATTQCFFFARRREPEAVFSSVT